MATVALSVLLNLDLPEGDIEASRLQRPCRHLVTHFACRWRKVICGKDQLAYDKLSVLILTAKIKKKEKKNQVSPGPCLE